MEGWTCPTDQRVPSPPGTGPSHAEVPNPSSRVGNRPWAARQGFDARMWGGTPEDPQVALGLTFLSRDRGFSCPCTGISGLVSLFFVLFKSPISSGPPRTLFVRGQV